MEDQPKEAGMMLSQEESARLIFIRQLDLGDNVMVPCLKGRGIVVEIADDVTVDMLDGPYYRHRFMVKFSEVYP